jgi:hypothetical protein
MGSLPNMGSQAMDHEARNEIIGIQRARTRLEIALLEYKDALMSGDADQATRARESAHNALDVVLACDDKMHEFMGGVLAGKRPARQ